MKTGTKDTIRPCRSCGTDIHLLHNPATGRWMPVDVATSNDGNVTIDHYRGTCQVLGGHLLSDARADETVDLHYAHHVTCPNAARHRGPSGDQAPPLFDAEELE